jgi:hypothetical protein
LRRLLDVRLGINMSVEVFDGHLVAQLPPLTDRVATRARRLIANGGLDRWRPMLEACLRTMVVQSYEGQAVVAIAAPLVVAGSPIGVVLVASTHDVGPDAGAVVRQMADWFSELIMGRLVPRPVSQPSAGVQQLSLLYKLLSESVPRSSDRMIVFRFAEALAVWADVEIRAYVADITGRYSLEVSLPGSDSEAAPAAFDSNPIPDDASFRHLSAVECRELGFHGVDAVVLASIGGQSQGGGSDREWLIAASPVAIDLDIHLPSYVDALSHALNDFYAVESSRLTWAMMQHFLEFDAADAAARAAVAEVSAYIHTPVHFAVFCDRGLVLFSGDHAALLASGHSADLVSVPVTGPAGYSAIVGTRRSAGRLFGYRDLRCLHTAASAFATWLPHALPQLVSSGGRRMPSRLFDRVVERQSAQAAAEQDDISLLVIAPPAGALGAVTAQRWIGRIREQLRPADLAGRLSSGDIGVLLPQTPRPGAFVVGKRLNEMITASGIEFAMPRATITVVSRSQESLVHGPLLDVPVDAEGSA